jgi:2-dehydro-3-deoxyphosphogluconate aldolase/(4S)-4-hydroxy-2-oxoglutarate aldolase
MTEPPKTAIDLMRRGSVIPVVVVERSVDAVPLARALLAGGVDTMEITLRTAEAVDAIRSVAEQVPGMAVGAGTIVRPDQARKAVGAGAGFLVSPGCTPRLLEALLDHAIPILARRGYRKRDLAAEVSV